MAHSIIEVKSTFNNTNNYTNNHRSHANRLTPQQREANKAEAFNTIFQLVLENLLQEDKTK